MNCVLGVVEAYQEIVLVISYCLRWVYYTLQIERAAKIARNGGPLYEWCDSCAAYPPPENKLRKCSRCKAAMYCNVDCQKAHWPQHKGPCKAGTVEPGELPSQVAYNAALSEVKKQVTSDERYFAALVIRGAQEGGQSASMVDMLSRLGCLGGSSHEVAEREELVGRVRRAMADELKEMRDKGRMQPDDLDSVVLAGLMVGQKINDEPKAG